MDLFAAIVRPFSWILQLFLQNRAWKAPRISGANTRIRLFAFFLVNLCWDQQTFLLESFWQEKDKWVTSDIVNWLINFVVLKQFRLEVENDQKLLPPTFYFPCLGWYPKFQLSDIKIRMWWTFEICRVCRPKSWEPREKVRPLLLRKEKFSPLYHTASFVLAPIRRGLSIILRQEKVKTF